MAKRTISLIVIILQFGLVNYASAEAEPLVHYEFEGNFAPTVGTITGAPSGGASISSAYNGVTIGKHALGDVLDVTAGSAYVTIVNDDIQSITTAITVAAWVKNDGTNWSRGIITRGYAWRLYAGSNRPTFQAADTDPSGSKVVASNTFDNEWHHLIGVYDGANYTLYIDGVQDGPSVPATGPIEAWGDSLMFGARSHQTQGIVKFFDGWIDDVRVYNVALSADEIRQISGFQAARRLLLIK